MNRVTPISSVLPSSRPPPPSPLAPSPPVPPDTLTKQHHVYLSAYDGESIWISILLGKCFPVGRRPPNSLQMFQERTSYRLGTRCVAGRAPSQSPRFWVHWAGRVVGVRAVGAEVWTDGGRIVLPGRGVCVYSSEYCSASTPLVGRAPGPDVLADVLAGTQWKQNLLVPCSAGLVAER